MNHKNKKRKNMFLILLVLLGTLGIGYAFLSQDLTINGTGKVTASNWHVYFDNLVLNQNNVALSTGDQDAVIDDVTETDITYTITLKNPGDFYEFTVDVVNDGTIDAMIGSVTSTLGGVVIDQEHPLPSYLNYTITYSDGRTILPNHLLEQNTSETYKVRLEFKTDITSTDLPSTDQSLTLGFGVNYVQRDASAIAVRQPSITRYIVNNGYEGYAQLNQPVPNGITLYETQQDALTALKIASTKDLPFYLKLTISNDIITESYVEVLINNTTKQNIITLACNSDTTCETKVNAIQNGTYTLRGGDGTNCVWDSDNGVYTCDAISPSYTANKAVIESMFGAGCGTEEDPGTDNAHFVCSAGSFIVYAASAGQVSTGLESDSFRVNPDGSSDCHWSSGID